MPDFWDRPGIERPHELNCQRASSAEVTSGPAHGSLTGFAFDDENQLATWRFRPDADAPAEDAFTVRLAGPAGTVTQRVAIHVVPREQNTAPHCGPATAAQRTSGTAPAVVAFDLFCWDDENDTMVIDGSRPGPAPRRPADDQRRQRRRHPRPHLALPHRHQPRRRGDDDLGHRRPRRPLGRRAADRPGRP